MTSNLVQIVENNLRSFLLHIGRVMEPEEFNSESIHWVISRSPVSYYNAVLRTQLQSDEASQEIDRFTKRLQYWQAPGHWFITPSVQPLDLEAQLIQYGFTLIEEEPQLAYDLAKAGSLPASRTDLQIQCVRTQIDLMTYASVLAHGFEDSTWLGEVFSCIGLQEDVPFQHYVGYFEGKPIAAASLLHCGETAGIYYVCVHAAYRQRGFGTAILVSTLREARQRGYQQVVLGATTQGYNLYLRLGFQNVCTFKFYEFKDVGPRG